jgi:hypothetical protein
MVSLAIKWEMPLHTVSLQIGDEVGDEAFAKAIYATAKGAAKCVERSAIAFGVERASHPDFQS